VNFDLIMGISYESIRSNNDQCHNPANYYIDVSRYSYVQEQ